MIEQIAPMEAQRESIRHKIGEVVTSCINLEKPADSDLPDLLKGIEDRLPDNKLSGQQRTSVGSALNQQEGDLEKFVNELTRIVVEVK